MASTDSRPVPIKNTAFRVVFPILDATGALVTGAAGLDSEASKDQGTFADCTNEAVEIATASGIYYLDLTAAEMNADCVGVIVKTSTTGAKTSVLVFYPQELGDIKVDVQSLLGTAWLTPGTAGRADVFAVNIAGTVISIVSPVAATGAISIVRGDDYYNADGRALTFTNADWPTLTGGTVTLKVKNHTTNFTGTVSAAQTARFELTAAQTTALILGSYEFDLEAVLSNGHVVTLIRAGTLTATAGL